MENTNEVKVENVNNEATIVDEKKFNFSPKELWNKHKGKVKIVGACVAGGALAMLASKGLGQAGAVHAEGGEVPFEPTES